MGISASGLASGMDVDGIISSMMKIEQSKTLGLKQEEALTNLRLTSYGEINSAVSGLKAAAETLANSTSFNSKVATSSGSDYFSGTASKSAFTGIYSIRVDAIAKEQNLASASFADSDLTSIGTGSINIKVGSGDTISVGITGNDSTLEGIQKAINLSDAAVNVSIVDDGSGPKLLLRSSETGTANTITVTVSDDDGNNVDAAGLSAFINANMTEEQPATDADFNVNGMDIIKSSNTVTDVIEGVTLNLKSADPTVTKTLSVTVDQSSPTKDINAFVDAYNDVRGVITSLTAVDNENNTRGPLTGDFTTRRLENDMRTVLGRTVLGIAGNYDTLSSLGITTQLDGTLSLSSGKLADAFTADPEAVSRVFGRIGTPTNSNVEFKSGTADTLTGTYGVYVSRAATRGSFTGTAIAAPITITVGVNDRLNMDIQGSTSEFILTPGTYNTGDDLATMVTAKISDNAEFTKKASATYTGGALVLKTAEYGNDTTVSVSGGSAAATLGLSAGTALDGLDIQGTIDGKVAAGVGQVLTGTNGLSVEYTGALTGSMGSVTYTIGIADMLNEKLELMTDPSNGALVTKTNGLRDSIKDIQKSVENESRRMAKVEDLLRMKFTSLEGIISGMNATGDFLTQQMDQLNKVAGGRSK